MESGLIVLLVLIVFEIVTISLAPLEGPDAQFESPNSVKDKINQRNKGII